MNRKDLSQNDRSILEKLSPNLTPLVKSHLNYSKSLTLGKESKIYLCANDVFDRIMLASPVKINKTIESQFKSDIGNRLGNLWRNDKIIRADFKKNGRSLYYIPIPFMSMKEKIERGIVSGGAVSAIKAAKKAEITKKAKTTKKKIVKTTKGNFPIKKVAIKVPDSADSTMESMMSLVEMVSKFSDSELDRALSLIHIEYSSRRDIIKKEFELINEAFGNLEGLVKSSNVLSN